MVQKRGSSGKSSITQTIFSNLHTKGKRVALRDMPEEEEYTYRDLFYEVEDVAQILVGLGVKKGDKCSIFSFNCAKWVIVDLAIQKIGAVSVPIYWKSSPARVKYVLQKAKPKVLFVGDPELYQILKKSRSKHIPSTVVLFESYFPARIYAWSKFMQLDRKTYQRKVSPKDLARIVYTSGSTGNPKGVMLTHGNLNYETEKLTEVLTIVPEDVFLSYLPMNHMFGLVGEVYVPLFAGSCVNVAHDPHEAFPLLKTVKPTIFLRVPFVLEKIYKKVLTKMSFVSGKLSDLDVGKLSLFQKLLFWKIHGSLHSKMGGNVRAIISGGAHLGRDVELFFRYAGMPLYQGYGMTEAAPVISVNTPKRNKLFSVGFPIDDVKMSGKGEVLVKGPNVMKGYYRNRLKTSKALSSGWLHTGDLGKLDKMGHLYISERKDDLIVLSKGKNVNPLLIEERIEEVPEVYKAIVSGHNKPYLVALLFVEGRVTRNTMENVLRELKKINAYLPSYERIRNYEILPASKVMHHKGLKLSRKKVMKQHENVIEKLYELKVL